MHAPCGEFWDLSYRAVPRRHRGMNARMSFGTHVVRPLLRPARRGPAICAVGSRCRTETSWHSARQGRLQEGVAGMSRETGQPRRTEVFRESDLKICQLCGQLNLSTNDACFVCGWHGRFEQDSELIRAAMAIELRRYGRLELERLTDPSTYRAAAPATHRFSFRVWIRRIWSWLSG